MRVHSDPGRTVQVRGKQLHEKQGKLLYRGLRGSLPACRQTSRQAARCLPRLLRGQRCQCRLRASGSCRVDDGLWQEGMVASGFQERELERREVDDSVARFPAACARSSPTSPSPAPLTTRARASRVWEPGVDSRRRHCCRQAVGPCKLVAA